METPLFLNSTKQQNAFHGEITEKRLKGIMVSKHPLMLQVVKGVLGPKFLLATHKLMGNSKIPAMFLAMLMYMGVSKAQGKKLYQIIFPLFVGKYRCNTGQH